MRDFLLRYGKCSKTFLFHFSNKMLVFRAGIHKNALHYSKQKQSDLGLPFLSGPFWQATNGSSVVECLTGDQGAAGSSLTGITVFCP